MENLNYKIIVNPAAGKGKGRVVAKVISEILNAGKKDFEIFHTKEPGHGIELAQNGLKDGWSAIVAVGGDGTVGEVLNGIMQEDEGKRCHFGFIPIGTGNDFARSLNIPLNMEEAIKVLLKPGRKVMDVGKEREGYFSIITGLGFPAEVMAQANAYKGPLRGSLIITWCVLKTIKDLKAELMEFTLDGETVDCRLKRSSS
jgi:diacylglycerol kinase (ATP)